MTKRTKPSKRLGRVYGSGEVTKGRGERKGARAVAKRLDRTLKRSTRRKDTQFAMGSCPGATPEGGEEGLVTEVEGSWDESPLKRDLVLLAEKMVETPKAQLEALLRDVVHHGTDSDGGSAVDFIAQMMLEAALFHAH
jgi:hypothetical protein